MKSQKNQLPFYYLKSCDSCSRILKEIPTESLCLINIKEYPVTKIQLEVLRKLSGSYESLFNFRAKKLQVMSPESKPKNEDDYKRLLLEDYTFLKRPVTIAGEKIFIGNQKATIQELKKALQGF